MDDLTNTDEYMENFAKEYCKHEVLIDPNQRSDERHKQTRRHAYKQIGEALNIKEWKSIIREAVELRRYSINQMRRYVRLSLVRDGGREDALKDAPPWLRRLDPVFNLYSNALSIESADNGPASALRRRMTKFTWDLYSAVREEVRRAGAGDAGPLLRSEAAVQAYADKMRLSVYSLHGIWCRMYTVSLRKLRGVCRSGDRPCSGRPTPVEWHLINLALLYDDNLFVLGEDSFSNSLEVEAMLQLYRLISEAQTIVDKDRIENMKTKITNDNVSSTESKETENNKSQETVNNKNQESLNNKNQETENNKSQETVNNKNQETVNNKNQETVNNKSQETVNNKNQEIVNNKNQESVNNKNQETVNYKNQETENDAQNGTANNNMFGGNTDPCLPENPILSCSHTIPKNEEVKKEKDSQLLANSTIESTVPVSELQRVLESSETTTEDKFQEWECAKLWELVISEYTKRDREASVVLLQRRWYELKQLARSRLLQSFRDPNLKPHPLLLVIAKRFPQVVTSPLPPWSDLVRDGRVFTAEHVSDQGESKKDEKVPSALKTIPSNMSMKDVVCDLMDWSDDEPEIIDEKRETIEISSNSDTDNEADGNSTNSTVTFVASVSKVDTASGVTVIKIEKDSNGYENYEKRNKFCKTKIEKTDSNKSKVRIMFEDDSDLEELEKLESVSKNIDENVNSNLTNVENWSIQAGNETKPLLKDLEGNFSENEAKCSIRTCKDEIEFEEHGLVNANKFDSISNAARENNSSNYSSDDELPLHIDTGADDNTPNEAIDEKLLKLCRVILTPVDHTYEWKKHSRKGIINCRRISVKQMSARVTATEQQLIYCRRYVRPRTCQPKQYTPKYRPLPIKKNGIAIYKNEELLKMPPNNRVIRKRLTQRLKLSRTYFSSRFWCDSRNLELLNACKPVIVRVDRLASRIVKKVELPDIEEVRRINRTILTAQVAPIGIQVPSRTTGGAHTEYAVSPYTNTATGVGESPQLSEHDLLQIGIPNEEELKLKIKNLVQSSIKVLQDIDTSSLDKVRAERANLDIARCQRNDYRRLDSSIRDMIMALPDEVPVPLPKEVVMTVPVQDLQKRVCHTQRPAPSSKKTKKRCKKKKRVVTYIEAYSESKVNEPQALPDAYEEWQRQKTNIHKYFSFQQTPHTTNPQKVKNKKPIKNQTPGPIFSKDLDINKLRKKPNQEPKNQTPGQDLRTNTHIVNTADVTNKPNHNRFDLMDFSDDENCLIICDEMVDHEKVEKEIIKDNTNNTVKNLKSNPLNKRPPATELVSDDHLLKRVKYSAETNNISGFTSDVVENSKICTGKIQEVSDNGNNANHKNKEEELLSLTDNTNINVPNTREINSVPIKPTCRIIPGSKISPSTSTSKKTNVPVIYLTPNLVKGKTVFKVVSGYSQSLLNSKPKNDTHSLNRIVVSSGNNKAYKIIPPTLPINEIAQSSAIKNNTSMSKNTNSGTGTVESESSSNVPGSEMTPSILNFTSLIETCKSVDDQPTSNSIPYITLDGTVKRIRKPNVVRIMCQNQTLPPAPIDPLHIEDFSTIKVEKTDLPTPSVIKKRQELEVNPLITAVTTLKTIGSKENTTDVVMITTSESDASNDSKDMDVEVHTRKSVIVANNNKNVANASDRDRVSGEVGIETLRDNVEKSKQLRDVTIKIKASYGSEGSTVTTMPVISNISSLAPRIRINDEFRLNAVTSKELSSTEQEKIVKKDVVCFPKPIQIKKEKNKDVVQYNKAKYEDILKALERSADRKKGYNEEMLLEGVSTATKMRHVTTEDEVKDSIKWRANGNVEQTHFISDLGATETPVHDYATNVKDAEEPVFKIDLNLPLWVIANKYLILTDENIPYENASYLSSVKTDISPAYCALVFPELTHTKLTLDLGSKKGRDVMVCGCRANSDKCYLCQSIGGEDGREPEFEIYKSKNKKICNKCGMDPSRERAWVFRIKQRCYRKIGDRPLKYVVIEPHVKCKTCKDSPQFIADPDSVVINKKSYVKLCDKPLIYAPVLSVVQSASMCARLARIGAELYLENVHTARRRRLLYRNQDDHSDLNRSVVSLMSKMNREEIDAWYRRKMDNEIVS